MARARGLRGCVGTREHARAARAVADTAHVRGDIGERAQARTARLVIGTF
jgi:hypothetical protein